MDASLAVKWFVPEPGQEAAFGVLLSGEGLIASDLVIAETLHALRKKLRAGDIHQDQYRAASADLPLYFDGLTPTASLARLAAQLSVEIDHGFYDCAYLALAISGEAELASADDRFVAKVRAAGIPVRIHPLSANI